MTTEFQDMSTICKPIRPGHVILPEARNFSAHVAACKKLRGGTTVVHDYRTEVMLKEELRRHDACFLNSSNFEQVLWKDSTMI